jgi:hypothetical protein
MPSSVISSFAEADVLKACAQYGVQLNVPVGLDGPTVMCAVASVESSVGADCGPRHEPAYDASGTYGAGPIMEPLLAEYGSSAACSYGPWQMMFCNYSGAYSPAELLADLEANAVEFVRYFNNHVAPRVASLSDIGQVWNGGHVAEEPSQAVTIYMARLQKAYDAAIAAQGATQNEPA